MIRSLALVLLLFTTGAALARDDRQAGKPQGIYSQDPETEAAFAPWTEFLTEIDRHQKAGTLPPQEEIIRRFNELEKQHGPMQLERLGRSQERNKRVPRL
jgi:hypothetical protein